MELINKFDFEYITEYVYYKNYDFLIHEIARIVIIIASSMSWM